MAVKYRIDRRGGVDPVVATGALIQAVKMPETACFSMIFGARPVADGAC